jgi:hypothetical protein
LKQELYVTFTIDHEIIVAEILVIVKFPKKNVTPI